MTYALVAVIKNTNTAVENTSKLRYKMHKNGNIEDFLEVLFDNQEIKTKIQELKASEPTRNLKYHRILTSEEKSLFTMEAHGFLTGVFSINQLYYEIMETSIQISRQVHKIIRNPISKDILARIIELIMFTGIDSLSVKDITEHLIRNPDLIFKDNDINEIN